MLHWKRPAGEMAPPARHCAAPSKAACMDAGMPGPLSQALCAVTSLAESCRRTADTVILPLLEQHTLAVT